MKACVHDIVARDCLSLGACGVSTEGLRETVHTAHTTATLYFGLEAILSA